MTSGNSLENRKTPKMKPSHVAQMLGLDPKTITGWTDHPVLRKYFSADAGHDRSRQREYSEADVFVLNTIRVERIRNTPWENIARILETGILEKDLPASSLLVKSAVPAAQYERFITLMNERDAALKEVERVTQESKQKDVTIEIIRQEKDAMLETLRHEIQRLNREIGRLEGKLELLQDDDKLS